MTDATGSAPPQTPAAPPANGAQPQGQAAAPPAQGQAQGQAPAGQQDAGSDECAWCQKAGTLLLAGALIGLAVVVLDIALDGRILGPIVAMFAGRRGPAGDTPPDIPND